MVILIRIISQIAQIYVRSKKDLRKGREREKNGKNNISFFECCIKCVFACHFKQKRLSVIQQYLFDDRYENTKTNI